MRNGRASEEVRGATTVSSSRTPAWAVRRGWILLLALGVLFLVAAVSDLATDAGGGLPADHRTTFVHAAGVPWATATQTTPGLTQ